MKFWLFLSFLTFVSAGRGDAALNVITSSEDLASIAQFIGGERVNVESLSEGNFDLHLIEPRPSMVVKVRHADMVIRVGMDLDMWMDSLINASRNKKVVWGAPGLVDCSVGITKLEIPQGKIDASMGDLHVYGNPHYWLDPVNGILMAETILNGLIRNSPENESFFRENYRIFIKDLGKKIDVWDKRMKPLEGKPIVTYHNSWIYFAQRFRLAIIGNIEPKPGLPPSPTHLAKLIDLMNTQQAKVILVDSFFPLQGPRKVAEKTGAAILIAPSSVGGTPRVRNYIDLFDVITEDLVKAFAP